MHIIKTQCLSVLLFLLLAFNTQAADNQVVMKGSFYGANTVDLFIVVDDIKFLIDNGTRVYDSNGQLRALSSIKPGQDVEMYFRKHGSQVKSASQLVLDKIIYYAE